MGGPWLPTIGGPRLWATVRASTPRAAKPRSAGQIAALWPVASRRSATRGCAVASACRHGAQSETRAF